MLLITNYLCYIYMTRTASSIQVKQEQIELNKILKQNIQQLRNKLGLEKFVSPGVKKVESVKENEDLKCYVSFKTKEKISHTGIDVQQKFEKKPSIPPKPKIIKSNSKNFSQKDIVNARNQLKPTGLSQMDKNVNLPVSNSFKSSTISQYEENPHKNHARIDRQMCDGLGSGIVQKTQNSDANNAKNISEIDEILKKLDATLANLAL